MWWLQFYYLTYSLDSIRKKTIFLFASFYLFFYSLGQPITKADLLNYKDWPRYPNVVRFYELNNFSYAWLNNPDDEQQLIALIQHSDSLGLNSTDYQYLFIQSYIQGKSLSNRDDSLDAEVRFTDASIHFFTELKYGNKIPTFQYNGLNYDPVFSNDIISEIVAHLRKRGLQNLASDIQLNSKEYCTIISKLNKLQRIIADSDFKDIRVTSSIADQSNKPLLIRLYQLGVTDSVIKSADKESLLKKIIEAQKLFDLLNDGALRSTTLYAFNVPLAQRIEELKTALNLLRWTGQICQNSSVLLLNIPSAYLMVYDKSKLILDSKVVVGKASTPTPTLTSTITEVILYPYWTVPNKIATKELLPFIKRDIAFLDRGNYQVLNNQGKIVNPYKIDWHSLSSNYFPYTIRQFTGCDNALGIIKFNFYNPFTVYLHDTPYKGLFSFNKRYFSHGCMRVENYLELAHFLLGKNRVAIDTLTEKGCLYQQAPKQVRVEKALPIMIVYSTVWYNKDGDIKFYDDIYGKLNQQQ